MSVYRNRGRPTKQKRIIADLYREGKCRECSVSVTRMDFAKILGKFTKVKIQYESSPRDKYAEKKITSPNTNARLRSNENGMVLIHRSAYKEHPAKEALAGGVRKTPPVNEPPRKRGRPPKNKNILVSALTTTEYRIVFYERRESHDATTVPEDGSIVDLLPSLSLDVLPTDEWLVDYLPHDEPKKDHVYDRIAAELEDLMYDAKPSKTEPSDSKTDDFPSIMELLNDALAEPERRDATDKPAEATGGGDVEAILRGDTEAADDTPAETKSKEVKESLEDKSKESEPTPVTDDAKLETESTENVTIKEENGDQKKVSEDSSEKGSDETQSVDVPVEENKTKQDSDAETCNDADASLDKVVTEKPKKIDEAAEEAPEKMEVDGSADSEATEEKELGEKEKGSGDKDTVIPMETDEISNTEIKENIETKDTTEELSKNVQSDNVEASKMNGKTPLLVNQNVNVETINYIIFKRVKNDECNRLVKCSKNLNYTIEMEGRPVELLGAPKYISCVDDLRLMLQIVHDSDLNSFNVVQGG